MIFKLKDISKCYMPTDDFYRISAEYMYFAGSVEKLLADVSVEVSSNMELYFPSSSEATAWLELFKDGIAFHKAKELVDTLTKFTDYKEYITKAVASKAASFEGNLNKDMYFTSSLKFKVNGDRRTRDNIQDLITFFDAQQQEGKISYRDYDNKEQKLTKENLQTILKEHITNGQNLYKQKWEKEQKIAAANSFDDLKAVSTEFEMSDFTGGQNNGLIPL